MAKKAQSGGTTKTSARIAAIAACKDKNGNIQPGLVIEASKNPKSILHKEFLWDNKEKGFQLWQLGHARKIIAECKAYYVVDDIKRSSKVFVRNPDAGAGYAKVASVRQDPDQAEQVLLDELRRIEGLVKRARDLAAVFGLTVFFDRLLDSLVEIRGKVRQHADEAREGVPA